MTTVRVALTSALLLFLLVAAAAGCSGPAPVELDAGAPDAAALDACTAGCTPDPCEALDCPDPRHECVVSSGTPACRCPAGTHAEGDRCVDDDRCTPTTCGGGGTCTDTGGTISCACPAGYQGDRCEACATGYVRNPEGLCDADLCDPSPCTDLSRMRCDASSGAAECLCNAGTHDVGGLCIPDTTCGLDTCSLRGTCSEGPAGPECACDAGFAGQFCDACDATGGYHADGAGGCTMDACLPDPCTTPPFSRCVAGAFGTTCECPLGMHADAGGCAVDETCSASSCSGHGTCSVTGGVASCACDTGYAGLVCGGCDTGYHDDGAGGCTDDVCVPSPCTMPGRGVCSAGPSGASCACDTGLHEDGVGGCTADPCLPHPCGAQACRAVSGAAECYTPMCDDGNPCTTDTPGPTGCTFAMRPDGSACSTTACITGRTCSAGVCGGGGAVTCDDMNPCTTDACDAVVGCTFVVAPTLVPDDGIACTTDSCATGTPTSTPSDAACDDGLYCTGVESCVPGAGSADARGCVRTAVPTPPPSPGPCATFGACSEATRSFPPLALPAGSACSDGIACTTGDQCVTTGGTCRGTVTPACTPSSCTSTTPWTSFLDVSAARVTGTITVAGAAPPAMVPSVGYGTATVWLVARDTRVRHYLGQLRYTSSVAGGYRLVAGDENIDASLVPGVYDLLYDRDTSTSTTGSGDRWVYEEPSSVPIPAGWRILREDVVIPEGASTITVDIPTATVTGSITVAGAAPPAMVPSVGYGTANLWLVAHDTGVRHSLGQLRYTSSVAGGYALVAGDAVIDRSLVPGTYDLLYDRDTSTSTTASGDRWVYEEPSSVAIPAGWRVIRRDVVIPPGPSTLAVDIPTATVTGSITVAGATPPAMVPSVGYGTATLWAVATDTGVRHSLGQLRYTSSVAGGYALVAGDAVLDRSLVPGTYDILYDRDTSTSTTGSGDRWVYEEPSSVAVPAGWRTLRAGVVIPAGASTLSIDIPTASVTGSITVDGAAPPAMVPSVGYGTATLWAVATDTGVRHSLGQLRYTSSVAGGYALVAGDALLDRSLVPGTYDILYDRDTSTSTTASGDRWVYEEPSSVRVPAGWRTLRAGVVIPAGASTLSIDIPTASVTGSITVDGAAPPAMVPSVGYGTATLWAVATDTGVRHSLGQLRYTSSVAGGYALVAGDALLDRSLVPGTYDILYDRDTSTSTTGSGDRWVYEEPSSVPVPAGWRILRTGVVILAGPSTLVIDVPTAALAGMIMVDGAAPPAMVPSVGYGTATFWAVARDTGIRHHLGALRYTSSVAGGYRLVTGDDLVDRSLVPGVYDILYDRDSSTSTTASGDRWVYEEPSSVPVPAGWRIIHECVRID